jgi:hypothetical protein
MTDITFGPTDVVAFLNEIKPQLDSQFDTLDTDAKDAATAAKAEAKAKHKDAVATADKWLADRTSEIDATCAAALQVTADKRADLVRRHAAALQVIATNGPVTITVPDAPAAA